MPTYSTMGGRIKCAQCKATSKRTKQRCKAPAMKNKEVCRAHGGLSTGPRTEQGKQRCAAAKTFHGRETRDKRKNYSDKSRELCTLESLSRALGLISGPKSPGRKPR